MPEAICSIDVDGPLRDAPECGPPLLGDHIRALRLERGLTQVELASAAGLAASTVVNTERGHYDPRLATIWALARGLGVKAHALVADVELTTRQHRRYRDLLKWIWWERGIPAGEPVDLGPLFESATARVAAPVDAS